MDQHLDSPVKKQECFLDINCRTKKVTGEAKMHMRPHKDAVLCVCAASMYITDVLINGHPARYVYRDPLTEISKELKSSENPPAIFPEKEMPDKIRALSEKIIKSPKGGELAIFLDDERKDSPFLITVVFTLRTESTFLFFKEGPENKIFLFSYPTFQTNRTWLPCLDDITAICTWEITCTITEQSKDDFEIISNGICIQKTREKENSTFKYRIEKAHASEIQVIGGNFQQITIRSIDATDGVDKSIALFCPKESIRLGMRVAEFCIRLSDFFRWFFGCEADPHSVFFLPHVNGIYYSRNISLLDVGFLYTSKTLEQQLKTQDRLLFCFARQWKAGIATSAPKWISEGIPAYAANCARKYFFGKNDALYCLSKTLSFLCASEDSETVSLDDENARPFSNQKKTKIFVFKALLLFNTLEIKLGQEILQKIVSALFHGPVTEKMLFSRIEEATGISMQRHIRECLEIKKPPLIRGSFFYDRKKTSLEMEIKYGMPRGQKHIPVGPLKIRIYEKNDIYDHTVYLKDKICKAVLPIHTKIKKKRKKEGETQESDSQQDQPEQTTLPVCFIVLDPENEWLCKKEMIQPKHMWRQQVISDRREITAQYRALLEIEARLQEEAIDSLEVLIADNKTFYKIRLKACTVLGRISSLENNFIGTARLLSLFYSRFCFQTPNLMFVPKKPQLDDIPLYFIQKIIPRALLGIKTAEVPQIVEQLYVEILRYSHDTPNRYSECFYISSLIRNCSACLERSNGREIPGLSALLDRFLSLEKILPSFGKRIHNALATCLSYLNKTPQAAPQTRHSLFASILFSSSNQDAIKLTRKYQNTHALDEDCSRSLLASFKYRKIIPLFSLSVARILFQQLLESENKRKFVPEEEIDWFDIVETDDSFFEKAEEHVVENVQKRATASYLEILDTLVSRHESIPFQTPITNVLGYRKIIKKPTDLQTIRKKCLRNLYINENEFAEDVFLMVKNCLSFNKPGSLICEHAKILELLFRREFRKYFGVVQPLRFKTSQVDSPPLKIRLKIKPPQTQAPVFIEDSPLQQSDW
eukprot:GHVN01000076.1.p1 GENE.GHVN01000076.1~~GHVN01000076.1.p1  ORF type:complete len:1046 (+),score=67.35 GHVN01000076.1:9-3146(+)